MVIGRISFAYEELLRRFNISSGKTDLIVLQIHKNQVDSHYATYSGLALNNFQSTGGFWELEVFNRMNRFCDAAKRPVLQFFDYFDLRLDIEN